MRTVKGDRYSLLVAIEPLENLKGWWKFECDCGNVKITRLNDVRQGKIKSCGCLQSSQKGRSGTREYIAQRSMMRRCKGYDHFKDKKYKELNITFDPAWSNLDEFIKDVGYAPTDGGLWTLDRIDNSKGYFKGNVKWSSIEEQARNKSMTSANTSGKTGVTWKINRDKKGKETTFATASWNDTFVGKRKSKSFSVYKYGLLEAFAMACVYRDEMIKELNKQGASYSENHGK